MIRRAAWLNNGFSEGQVLQELMKVLEDRGSPAHLNLSKRLAAKAIQRFYFGDFN